MPDIQMHDLIELRRDGQPWLISARAIASIAPNGSTSCSLIVFTTDDNNVTTPAPYVIYADNSYEEIKQKINDLKS